MNEKRAWIKVDRAALLALLLPPFAYGVPFSLVDVTLGSFFRSVYSLALIAMLALTLHVCASKTIEVLLKVKTPLIVSLFMPAAALLATTAALYDLGWGYWVLAGGCGLVALAHMVGPHFSYRKEVHTLRSLPPLTRRSGLT